MDKDGKKNQVSTAEIVRFAAIAIILIWTVFPIVWMILTSFKPEMDIQTMPPKYVFLPTLENYLSAFVNQGFLTYVINSLVITISSTLIVMVVGVPAAYSFARFSPGGGQIIFYILSTKMMPAIAIVIPYFIIFTTIHLMDTQVGMIIVYTMFNIPIGIWLMHGFFKDVPEELEDAARIDGYSRINVFRRVVLPLVAPGLAVTAVFCMMYAWNEFLFAFVLTRTQAATIPVGISGFWNMEGVNWGPLSAAAVISVVPMLLFALALQKYLIRGLTFGAVKG